jgi:hypothetical protein
MISLKDDLLVVALFPFKIPALAKNHEPVQILRMNLAPGACCLRNGTIDSAAFCNARIGPVGHEKDYSSGVQRTQGGYFVPPGTKIISYWSIISETSNT